MASELSRFIEDELKKQGINDDEEQRLLSNLRVKPLSVQAPGGSGGAAGWSTKQKALIAAVVLACFAGLAFSVLHFRGQNPLTTGNWRGGLAEPEAGAEPLPPLPTKGGDKQQKEQQKKEAAAAEAAEAEAELEQEEMEEEGRRQAPAAEKASGGKPKNETQAATPELSEAELKQLEEEGLGDRRRRQLRRRGW